MQGIEQATGQDIARIIVDYVDNQVAFPELDVRQRLSVSRDHGVAELLVREDGGFVGQTLGEAGLSERDITVLTVQRGVDVIANPKPNLVLEANDKLLCFGRLEEMRDMIPKRRSRRRRLIPPPNRDDSISDTT